MIVNGFLLKRVLENNMNLTMMVETWAIIHEEELKAEWKSIIELGQHFKIDGLR